MDTAEHIFATSFPKRQIWNGWLVYLLGMNQMFMRPGHRRTSQAPFTLTHTDLFVTGMISGFHPPVPAAAFHTLKTHIQASLLDSLDINHVLNFSQE